MKTVLRGDVRASGNAGELPKALRVVLRRAAFNDATLFVEGEPLGQPETVRVLMDMSVPIAEAGALAAALRNVTAALDRHVASFVASGGRVAE